MHLFNSLYKKKDQEIITRYVALFRAEHKLVNVLPMNDNSNEELIRQSFLVMLSIHNSGGSFYIHTVNWQCI